MYLFYVGYPQFLLSLSLVTVLGFSPSYSTVDCEKTTS